MRSNAKPRKLRRLMYVALIPTTFVAVGIKALIGLLNFETIVPCDGHILP